MLETLCIRITKHCNLSCSHCRAGSSPRTKTYLDEKIYIEALLELKKIGLKHVSISGGEPFLVKNLANVVETLLENDLYISITTNGTIDTALFINSFTKEQLDKIKIRISLDGSKSFHESIRGINTYDNTINELIKIKTKSNWVGINSVLIPNQKNEIEKIVSDLRGTEIDEWCLITPVAKGTNANFKIDEMETLEEINLLRNSLKREANISEVIIWDFISSPLTSILIESNGNLLLSGVKEGQDIIVSNIRNLDIRKVESAIQQRKKNSDITYFEWPEKKWKKATNTMYDSISTPPS